MEQLSRAARAQLRFLLHFRDRPLTVWGQFAANRRLYGMLLAGTGVGAALLYVTAGPTFAACLGVMFVTAVLRDIGLFRRAALGWPVTCSVIDWQRVERLLAIEDSHGVGTDPAEGG